MKKLFYLLVLALILGLVLAGCLPSKNQSPIITSTPSTLAEVDELYTYEVEATDPDGDTLTYSLDVKPSGMTIDSATGLISWTPTAEGDYDVVVKVSDGALDITQSFTIVAIEEEEPGYTPPVTPPVNLAPTITSSPITTAIEGADYIYDVEATDPEGDTLTYSLTTNPIGMTIDSATGVISWTPTSAQIGDNNVTVEVSDGPLSDTQSFTVVVAENQPPIADAGPNRIIVTKASTPEVTFVGTGTDPDGTVVSYSWDFGDSNTGTGAIVSHIYGALGTYTVTLTVTDNGGANGSDTMSLKIFDTIQGGINAINPVNLIEVMSGTYDEDVTINQSLTLVSDEGRDNTIINGQSTGNTGAIVVNAGISDVTIGNIGQGFTINAAGQTAIYLVGTNDNITIRDNKIVATINGNCALETSGLQSNHTIADNEFSGTASQLVYIGGEASHGINNASTNVNFTNNTFAGTATGPALGQEATDSTISGNTFATVTGYASLELWGTGSTVTGNDFTADLPTGGLYVLDNPSTLDIAAVLNNNTFLRAVTVEHNPLLPKIWAYIQDAVSEADDGDTILVSAGTYNVHIINQFAPYNKSFNLIGAGADVVTWTAPSGQYPLQLDQQSGVSYEISGFKFVGDGAHCIKFAGADFADLDVHDNVFEIINPDPDSFGLFMCRIVASRTSGVSSIRVHDNVFNTEKGICMSNAVSFDIYNNEFNVNVQGIYSAAGCKTSYVVGDHKIYQNNFTGLSGDAIKLDYWADSHPDYLVSIITHNNFESIGGYAVNVTTDRSITEDAENNWWGDGSGPYNIVTNLDGLGNAVSDNVDFDPWSTEPY